MVYFSEVSLIFGRYLKGYYNYSLVHGVINSVIFLELCLCEYLNYVYYSKESYSYDNSVTFSVY